MDTTLDPGLGLRIRRTESLTSLIRRELERMIEVGELKAGDRLNENSLAAKLGVSRGPVREACRGLEQSGLVHVIVNRGVFVREISNREAAELYDIRASLYALAGRLLAPKITKKQVTELRRMIRQMDDAADKGELNIFYPLNVRFHEAIVEFSGNGRLLSMCASVHREMHLFRRRTLDMPGRMKISNAEHTAIVDALETKDSEKAAQVMAEHVLTSRTLLFGPIGTPAG
ncbi:FCD domain-containing protein [Microvirga sp. TS319]|uniref:FCD domain-containing protein n=1 Tax=Microvirga sp. TS319 TaxID=3241165 RepID=UPI00351A2FBB